MQSGELFVNKQIIAATTCYMTVPMVTLNVSFQMDETTTFLEYPLDQNVYEPKEFVQPVKKPLRILVTEAGSKIAYNLIYKICSGSVFGSDQEIILHLINARGAIPHKTIVLELLECGFSCFKDYVVSSNPALAFRNVEIVIAIATFEEIPGFILPGAMVHQTVKAVQLLKRVQEYSAKDCKIIFTGPSTKATTLLLNALYKFAPDHKAENISSVTHLDTVISKAILAAKLKVTTDRIKNVIIWSATYPDVRNATVKMYPPEDLGATEMKDIPVAEILQDEEWLYSNFGTVIYRRIMNFDLLHFGKAIALSTAHHLRLLFEGSENFEEIHSMAVITPSEGCYNQPAGMGFSYPVTTKNGKWKILQNISTDVVTQINMMKTQLEAGERNISDILINVVSHVIDYDISTKQMAHYFSKDLIDKLMEIKNWTARYFVVPSPSEDVENLEKKKSHTSRKSIAWSEGVSSLRKFTSSVKPSIVFSDYALKSGRRNSRATSVDLYNEDENPLPFSLKRHSVV